MKVETIKALFTYLTALVIIVGGFIFLYSVRSDPTATGLIAIVAGFIGSAITFLFNSESASRATAAAAASTQVGVGMSPTVTTTAGPPQTTTITPPPAVEGEPA